MELQELMFDAKMGFPDDIHVDFIMFETLRGLILGPIRPHTVPRLKGGERL